MNVVQPTRLSPADTGCSKDLTVGEVPSTQQSSLEQRELRAEAEAVRREEARQEAARVMAALEARREALAQVEGQAATVLQAMARRRIAGNKATRARLPLAPSG